MYFLVLLSNFPSSQYFSGLQTIISLPVCLYLPCHVSPNIFFSYYTIKLPLQTANHTVPIFLEFSIVLSFYFIPQYFYHCQITPCPVLCCSFTPLTNHTLPSFLMFFYIFRLLIFPRKLLFTPSLSLHIPFSFTPLHLPSSKSHLT